MRRNCGSFSAAAAPAFDVQMLGLGVEGHVASLFPGSPALEEQKRWVMAVEAPAKPSLRLTLTPAVLNRGAEHVFPGRGANKREIVAALRSEPTGEPSQYPGRYNTSRGARAVVSGSGPREG